MQIAEAILEQFDNFPDGSLRSRQRSLDTLLPAYDLTHQSTQMWQNGEDMLL